MGNVLDKISTAPTFKTAIPSTGKKIEFRPFTVGEEQILLTAKESQDTETIIDNTKKIIEKCTFDQVDADKLASFDIEWLLLQLRAKSVGEHVDLRIKCSECKTPNDIQVNINDIKMPKVEKGANFIKFNEKVGVTLHYPGFDVLEKMTSKDVKITTVIASLIESIVNGEDVHNASDFKLSDIEGFLLNLRSVELKKISDFIASSPHVTHTTEFLCIKCTKKTILDFRGINNFFS